MKKRVIVFSGLLLVSSMWMKADENETSKDKENTFSMSAQIRPRAEYRNGVLNVITAGDVPVQSAEDTFVIVDERLASELSKEAVSEVELCPGLVQDETAVLVDLRVLSPDAYVLCGKADREVLPLVIHGEAGTVIDEAGRLLPFADWTGTSPAVITTP